MDKINWMYKVKNSKIIGGVKKQKTLQNLTEERKADQTGQHWEHSQMLS